MVKKVKWSLWFVFSLTNLFIFIFSLTSLIFFFEHVGDRTFAPTNYNTPVFFKFIFRASLAAPYWVSSYYPVYSTVNYQFFSILPFLLIPLGYLLFFGFSIFAYLRDYNLTLFPLFGIVIILTLPYGYVVGFSYLIICSLLILISSEYNKYISFLRKHTKSNNNKQNLGKEVKNQLSKIEVS